MAENTLVKEQLTDAMIEAGEMITRKLDESGLPISLALWLFQPDNNQWRLLFASPLLATAGPRAIYQKIDEARATLGSEAEHLPLSAIGLLDTRHQLAQLLPLAVRTGPGVSRIRFSRNAINGHFIEDALIYRAA